jgi:hypothetical protein
MPDHLSLARAMSRTTDRHGSLRQCSLVASLDALCKHAGAEPPVFKSFAPTGRQAAKVTSWTAACMDFW